MNELVRARNLYRLERSAPVPYDRSKLNVLRNPAGKGSLVELPEILPSQEKRWVANFESHLLLPPELRDEALEGAPSPYWDPKLRRSKTDYVDLLTGLADQGIISYRRRVRGRVGIFFVAKKNGDIRMVIDCRAVNRLFRIPPRTRLVSGTTLSEIWLPGGGTLFALYLIHI